MDEFFYVLTDKADLLVIDDDPIMREFASVYLSTPTTTVSAAEDGEKGLALLAQRSFDLVLLDIDMPGLDGFEVLKRLRADPSTAALPVVVATGREDIASIDKAFALGATSFVIKPVNWRLLAYQVRYVMRAHAVAMQAAAPDRAVPV